MSAIAGIYNLNNEEPVSIEHVNGMMKALEKFPADDIQVWRTGPVFLGCHAQWITPESIDEQLPFYDSERKCAITADCIIDNREELFEALQVPRDDQRTIPDSLLILLAYYKWGEDCPKHLIGDFAFMIWDERERKWFGARDFSGARTLYYFNNGKQFGFCTVIKPFFSLPYLIRELNEEWMAEFLAITGMVDTVDASLTPYENIYQVPPSNRITIHKNKISVTKYNSFNEGTRLKLKSNEEYVEAFQNIFGAAVKSRLRTYKEVGAHLSGGLDSGSVVSFAAKELDKKKKVLHTFSYIPPENFKDYTAKHLIPDERPYIKLTVNHVGGISDNYYNYNDVNSYTEIDDLLEMMEMPYKFFENSFWLKGTFEKAQEKGVGILLNGDRGNSTISWGSALDYYAILLKKIKWIKLYQELNQYSKNAGGARLRRLPFIARLAFPSLDRMFQTSSPYRFPTIINKDLAEKTGIYSKLSENGMDETGWFVPTNIYKLRTKHFEDVFQWNATSTFGSKLSLSYSLWKRDPTNDLRVIRFCLSVPEGQYVQNGFDRALVRRATKEYLPDGVRLNMRVRGVQGADWVHRIIPYWDDFIKEIKEILKDDFASQYLNFESIKESLQLVEGTPRVEYATNPNYRVLMRSIIVYRFIKNFF
jgi:asparagine synthetase B (glutamine-hydrolysing)